MLICVTTNNATNNVSALHLNEWNRNCLGILNYLNDKYDHDTTEKLLDMATLLDPWFKTGYMREERINSWRAAAEMQHLVARGETTETAVSIPPPTTAPAATADESELPAVIKAKKSLFSYFKKPAAPKTSQSQAECPLNWSSTCSCRQTSSCMVAAWYQLNNIVYSWLERNPCWRPLVAWCMKEWSWPEQVTTKQSSSLKTTCWPNSSVVWKTG